MGGDSVWVESDTIDDYFRNDPCIWMYAKEGDIVSFMEAMTGFDENLSMRFVSSWNDRRVVMGDISFEISEDVIAQATGLSTKVRKWKKTSRVADETSMNCFYIKDEDPVKMQGGFNKECLPYPWDQVCKIIMKYFTLEGRYGVFYYYHLRCSITFATMILFLSRSFYCTPSTVKDVCHCMTQDSNYIILHKGLMFRLYNFHRALCPPKPIYVQPAPSIQGPLLGLKKVSKRPQKNLLRLVSPLTMPLSFPPKLGRRTKAILPLLNPPPRNPGKILKFC